ncbi:MAG: hypothetical protein IPJ81_17970 [Chitinophagaceae bacterium]|nr:hypothetical protein [Chitinophagaceae bacterium]
MSALKKVTYINKSSITGVNAWNINGNTGTDPDVNFIGTTDDEDLTVGRNNLQIARFSNPLGKPKFIIGLDDFGEIELGGSAPLGPGENNITSLPELGIASNNGIILDPGISGAPNKFIIIEKMISSNLATDSVVMRRASDNALVLKSQNDIVGLVTASNGLSKKCKQYRARRIPY